ncbi:energy transducer TonB [Variovorax paradoxus]|uniref:IgA-specific serine endopeptidase autotransporter n=1 Tax=Variovorax paradoxus TaxID=34073 RepID=A0A679IZJ2_VARPD|nr:IgA-specific serine endopeptidase autotransporter [Variovorax paradoxus]
MCAGAARPTKAPSTRNCGRPRCSRRRPACRPRRRPRRFPRHRRLRLPAGSRSHACSARAPPPPVAKAPEPAPAPKAPDIALEREKKLKEQKEQKERELEKQQQQKKKELEARQRAEEEAEKKQEQQKKLAEQKKQQQEAEAKKAEAAKQAEAKKAEAAAKQAAADRAATLKRMQGLAGASGSDDSKGTALRTSGPSSGYAGRIAAAVRPNITFPDADTVNGNPAAEFEVSLAPDGTIVNVKLSKSSGLPGWDEAAERGLRKTDRLPRDTDGRIFPSLIVSLRPKR